MADKEQSVSETNYSPLYFLSSLGNGGLAIAFYMYIHFMLPHPGAPMASFESILAAFRGDNLFYKVLTVFSISMFLFCALRHFKYLIFNIKSYKIFKKSPAFNEMIGSNAESSLMAIPLTFAMTINVCFVLGSIFVPNLWSFVEYLFPGALLGFFVVGIFALKIFYSYFKGILVSGDFDCTKNNNLGQMISVFTFAMVAVGLSAAGAMSQIKVTASIGIFLALFFLTVVFLIGIIQFVLGFRGMLSQGVDQEGSVSLWIIIPIVTLVGIATLRISHGLDHFYGTNFSHGYYFVVTAVFVSTQVFFGILGYSILKENKYFEEYIHGEKIGVSSYALICPGVAFVVFFMFFMHHGMVKADVMVKYSPFYFIILIPIILIQAKTLMVFLRLDKKHFSAY